MTDQTGVAHGRPTITINKNAAIEAFRNDFAPVIAELEKYEYSKDQMNPMIDFAMKLFVNHRDTMKPHRIARKTAEQFHLSKRDS